MNMPWASYCLDRYKQSRLVEKDAIYWDAVSSGRNIRVYYPPVSIITVGIWYNRLYQKNLHSTKLHGVTFHNAVGLTFIATAVKTSKSHDFVLISKSHFPRFSFINLPQIDITMNCMHILCVQSYISNKEPADVVNPNPKPPADSNNCHSNLCSVIQQNNRQKRLRNISNGVSSFLWNL